MISVYLGMIETQEEQTKFEVLYAEYRPLMLYVAREILHNQQDAEDAVHNAFLKVAENMRMVEEAVSPRTKSLLVTIVENKAIDVYREKQRHGELNYDDAVEGLQVEFVGDNALASCMARLPARYREVLMLKYHLGYDDREIGKIMGISKENAKRLCTRAKDKLGQLCREEGLL